MFGGGGKGFFSRLSGIFKSIVKFATGGPFKMIMGFAKGIGRILGKVFLPITILMGIFDFVKGFMRGYEEGGIVEGIKQGVMDLVDGLIGGLIRMLMWIPTKLAEWLGLDNLATAIGEYTDDVFAGISEIFSGLVDFLKGLFTWDTEAMSESLGKVWEGIKKVVLAPFIVIQGLVKDIFGGTGILRAELALKSVSLAVASFFFFLQEGVASLIGSIPDWLLTKGGEDWRDSFVTRSSDSKRAVDAEKEEIDALRKRLADERAEEIKKKEEAERIKKADELKEKSQTNINTSNNSNSAVVNNVTNIINNSSNNISAAALRNALG